MDGDAAYAAIADLVTERLGLAAQKRWAEGIARLLPAIIGLTGAADFDGALQHLRTAPLDGGAWRSILAAVTIGETRFLRQRSWFERIERTALAALIQQRRRQNMRRLHIWSAGCSTGEEPYTLAVILQQLLPDFREWRIDILGTDARIDAIELAEHGVFEARQLRELAPWQVERAFVRVDGNHLSVVPELRRNVRFHVANLMDQAAAGHGIQHFDLILCRNVLMYMEPAAQRGIARYLVSALSEDGWLAVSPAEALADWFKPLTPVNTGEAILFTRRLAIRTQPPAQAPSAAPTVPPAIAAARPQGKIKLAAPAARASADAAAALRQARDLADRGGLEEARLRCQEILAADRLNVDAALLLAEICSDIGDDAAAHTAARTAVYVAPDSAQAHFLLAGALLRLGKPDRAAKAMTTARSLAAAAEAADSAAGEMPEAAR
jgi:chemotaxis protein methyltransferase CheR